MIESQLFHSEDTKPEKDLVLDHPALLLSTFLKNIA